MVAVNPCRRCGLDIFQPGWRWGFCSADCELASAVEAAIDDRAVNLVAGDLLELGDDSRWRITMTMRVLWREFRSGPEGQLYVARDGHHTLVGSRA